MTNTKFKIVLTSYRREGWDREGTHGQMYQFGNTVALKLDECLTSFCFISIFYNTYTIRYTINN